MASKAVALIARHYIPKAGLVYDLGTSTGNMGRVLAEIIKSRQVSLIGIDECQDMIQADDAPGKAIFGDITKYSYKRFDVAISFLTFMFLNVSVRRQLLEKLKQRLNPGGAIIIFDKEEPPSGYTSTILARLTWAFKISQGVEPGEMVTKELSLAGIQRPLYKGELGLEAVEVFRFGDFAG